MSRPDRWWRPTTTRRPPLRARRPRMYSGQELDATFDTAYSCGEIAERKRHEQREEWLRRLDEACDAVEQGNPEPMRQLGRQAAGEDLLDVADAAGVTPMDGVGGADLIDEVERWLREQ